jgi:hypothetical protein
MRLKILGQCVDVDIECVVRHFVSSLKFGFF